MAEFWETSFQEKQIMWGDEPTLSALFARDHFLARHAKTVLIPGIGYGRNAKPFLSARMTVAGIEISNSAIQLARSKMQLGFTIHHGSVTDMPFDTDVYDGIFCHGLIHLLDENQRRKLIKDCYAQLSPGGGMIFTAISIDAPSFGKGVKIGHNRFEQFGGAQIFFYDQTAIESEFDPYGLVEVRKISEPHRSNPDAAMPFLTAVCAKK